MGVRETWVETDITFNANPFGPPPSPATNPSSSHTTTSSISVQITTLTWANEITWNIDGGAPFGPYEDNTVNDQVLDLAVGPHVLQYFDSYGDGWHGGY